VIQDPQQNAIEIYLPRGRLRCCLCSRFSLQIGTISANENTHQHKQTFVSFFAGAFFVAVLAFATAVEPVTAYLGYQPCQQGSMCLTFFAGARLAVAVVFLTGAAFLALPASVFFGEAGFLVVVAFATTDFFLVGAAAAFVAGLAVVLEAGLEF
jgi:hypothetical protein